MPTLCMRATKAHASIRICLLCVCEERRLRRVCAYAYFVYAIKEGSGEYAHMPTLCMRATKALASLRICADSPEPSLLVDCPNVFFKKSDKLCIVSRFYEDNQLETENFRKIFFIISDCGKSIHSDGSGGLIKSPHYPQKYKSKTFCEWNIYASKKENKILLQLESFKIEGKMPNETNSKAGNVFVYFICLVDYELQCIMSYCSSCCLFQF